MLKVMRARYESLAVHDLKEIAKARGIKGISAMKKADIIEEMLSLDAMDEKERQEKENSEKQKEGAAQENGNAAPLQEPLPAGKRARHRSHTAAPVVPEPGPGAQGRAEDAAGSLEAAPDGHRRDTVEQGAREHSRDSEEQTGGGRSRDSAEQSAGGHSRDGAEQSVGSRSRDGEEPEAGRGAKKPAQPPRGTPRPQKPEGGKVIMSRSQEPRYYSPYNKGTAPSTDEEEDKFPAELDSGITVSGILEVMTDGYGFIRSANYLPGENDIYVAPSQIRRFGLKTGDILEGNTRIRTQNEKFSALLYVKSINGYAPEVACRRPNFEDMTPIFPDSRLKLEKYGSSVAMRIMDLLSPIGKGQRGMIVSPPKAGKTTLLKEVAMSVKRNYPDMHLIILLIDERPEEVTDMRETVEGPNVEVIYSTFDELPEHHKRVSEMVVERARRLVEHKQDVMILLDSITRLARAYNLVVQPSGRTLSGGIDPAALHMPKRFFGAARNMREGGSLTILVTALVETGSKMDDVIYEEFKGTGNMELVLDRKLSEKRLFPAIDIPKTSTRREDLLLNQEEMEAINIVRRALNGMKSDEAADRILDLFSKTRNNAEFVQSVKKMRFI